MSEQRPTIKAVIAYAERLRDRADRATAQDPYARPYYPTTATARKVYHEHLSGIQREDHATHEADASYVIDPDDQRHRAAEAALATLASRAAKRDRERDEQEQEANRAVKRLVRHKRRAERDREADRAGLTVGQRIDRALAALATVAAPGAAQIGASVSGGDRRVPPSNHGDPAGEAAYVARHAMLRVEELLDQARSRDLSKVA